jgi:hypothetical protein
MGTGTSVDQAFMLRRREQGTSTDLPWHQRTAPTQQDQSTCTTEETNVSTKQVVVEEEETIQNSPWRRMVMAATAAAAERARLEPLPGTTMTMTQGTVTSPSSSGGGIHYSNKKKSRRDSAAASAASAAASAAVAAGTSLSYDSGVQERERDYSVIKDTCHALTEELRTFGAYVMAVDQQCRPTIEMFVQCLQVNLFFVFFFCLFDVLFFLLRRSQWA